MYAVDQRSGLLIGSGGTARHSRAPVRRRLVVLAEIEAVGLLELALSSLFTSLFQLGAILLFSFGTGPLGGLGLRGSVLVLLPIAFFLLSYVSLITTTH